MLSRYHISVERYPDYMEKVIIKTWPSACKGFFTLREYTMESEKGDILARMTSSFVVYDLSAKKIVPVEKHLPIEAALLDERAIDDKFPSLQLPERIDHSEEICVRKHDIDINRHVNNVADIEIALESVPIDILLHYDLSDAQITFKAQAFYGDTLLSQCEIIPEEDEYRILHHVLNKQGNTSILKMVTNWVKKSH
jgi:acyl-ACP thioesterase